MIDLTSQRQHMVAQQILARGVRDKHVLVAMGKVHREAFVPEPMRDLAYADTPLPIAAEQTISQLQIAPTLCSLLDIPIPETMTQPPVPIR